MKLLFWRSMGFHGFCVCSEFFLMLFCGKNVFCFLFFFLVIAFRDTRCLLARIPKNNENTISLNFIHQYRWYAQVECIFFLLFFSKLRRCFGFIVKNKKLCRLLWPNSPVSKLPWLFLVCFYFLSDRLTIYMYYVYKYSI